jgi:Ca-activated chloride channel family protein
MRLFILSFFSILTNCVISQVEFAKTKHDFGNIYNTSDRFIDIIVTNKNPKKEFLLSVKKPVNVVYLVNGQFMEKDGSLTVRLQVNPKEKGKFSYDVQIYTSDKAEPTIIKLTGNLAETPSNQTNNLQACPDFNTRPNLQKATEFELTVITIDKITKELLSQSTVTILQNGRPQGNYLTNKKGEIKQKVPLGFAYFYASHIGYLPSEKGSYVTIERNTIVLELEKNPTIIPVEKPKQSEEIVEKPIEQKEITIAEAEKNLEKQLEIAEKIAPKVIENKIPIKLNELDKNNFDESNFKPLNVTFVLDISASMRAGEKMELMKFSLYQLTDMLRKQDRISIVTYSTDTRVLLPTTDGTQKEEIKKMVGELRAGGLTAGGAGIKLGYKQTLKSFISDGTNQIVIITDGAFNRNSDDYKKYIKKYKKKGINMTVVGILNSEKDKIDMIEAAELGGGRYVPIFKLADALNNLKQEIRFLCFREK